MGEEMKEDYLHSKRYLVNPKDKLILPIAFQSGFEALEYARRSNLPRYQVVVSGGDVRRFLGQGFKEAFRDLPTSMNGAKAVPYTVPVTGPKFDLGQVVMTSGVAEKVAGDSAFAKFVADSLKRHATGDWGELSEEDQRENDFSLDKRLRLFSAYETKTFPKLWILTEADRSATTILFPEEY